MLVMLAGSTGGLVPFERLSNAELQRILQAHPPRRENAFVELEVGQPNYVLVAGWGEKRTGGYVLRIERVSLRRNRLKVQVRTQAPAPDAMVTQALTYPVDAVLLPAKRLGRSKSPISIDLVDQEGKILATAEAR